MKAIFCVVLILLVSVSLLSGQNAQRISPAGISYIDPEIYSDENKLAFQTGSGNVWLSDLDSLTGLFVSANGMDVLIDTGATALVTSFNGPEFGVDQNGWAVFYTKKHNGVSQAWRATPGIPAFQRQALTSGPVPRLSILAIKSTTSPGIHILYSKGSSLQTGQLGWTSEDNPANETIIDSSDVGVRWIDGMRKFFYISQTGADKGQLFLYDTETNTETQITSDTLLKTYSYGWFAPEYNQLAVLALIGDTTFGIYKDNGNAYWDLLYTMDVPPASAFDFIGSPEVFVAGGKSYISFVTKIIATGSNYVPAEVWVMDIEPDVQQRFMLRCDDGAANIKRTDPESYIGANEVFIYYNLLTESGTFEVWRFATGISTSIPVGNNELETNDHVRLYPNPTGDLLNVSGLPLDFTGTVTFFNNVGQAVLSERKRGAQWSVETNRLHAGMYWVQLRTENGAILTRKLVKN